MVYYGLHVYIIICLFSAIIMWCDAITYHCNMYIFLIFPNAPFILMMVIITEMLQIHSLKLVRKQC